MKVSLPVIQVNELRIWGIVPQDNIKIPIAVDVDQLRGIGPERDLAKIVDDREANMAVIEQDPTHEGPVPPFRKDDVEIAVVVEVADAHIC